MKKLFVALMFFISICPMASAYYGNDLASGLGLGMNQLIEAGEQMLGPFFSAILGGSGDMLFERILFLAIILAVVYIVISGMEVFKENKVVIWVVSVSIALLSTRFLVENNLVQAMILPYSVFGVALSAAIPILVYFKFVQSFGDSATVRKMLWIFFIVVFVGIWGARYDDIGDLSWIYMGTAIAALIFLLFDGTIRRYIVKQERDELGVKSKEKHLAKLREELEDLRDNERHYNPSVFKKLEKDKMKSIKRVSKSSY
ncbi:MAG: hypothetical protein ABIF18_02300 [archaeon]